jgi:hypothetical protein
LPGSDEIPAELIQAGGKILLFAIHKLFNSVWNNEELPDQWEKSIIVPVHKKGDKTNCNNYCGISLLSTSYKILSNILLSRLSPYIDEIIGDHQCGFRRNSSVLIRFSAFVRHWRKKWEYNSTSNSTIAIQLFINFKQAHDSMGREVFYSILIEFGVPMKLVRLIKMCLMTR